MSLLREITDAAVDTSVEISTPVTQMQGVGCTFKE